MPRIAQEISRGRCQHQIQELEEQVGARENIIEVLEDQLINTQQQLQEANQHLDMHHQEIQDMEAEGADEDVDIEEGEEPEPESSLDTADSGRPPSPGRCQHQIKTREESRRCKSGKGSSTSLL